jgi:hypothetical protein
VHEGPLWKLKSGEIAPATPGTQVFLDSGDHDEGFYEYDGED